MKTILTRITLALSTLALPAMMHAQAQDVAYGRLTVNFSSNFLNSISAAGITVTDLNGIALQSGTAIFAGVSGSLNPSSAAGELNFAGGYILGVNGNVVELSSPVIDTTNLSAPMVTVLVVVNGSVVGRIPLFTLAAPPGFSTPLATQAGTVLLSGIYVSVAPAMASELNGLLGGSVIAAGLSAGTETQYSVFSTYSGS